MIFNTCQYSSVLSRAYKHHSMFNDAINQPRTKSFLDVLRINY